MSAQLAALAATYGQFVQGECEVPVVPQWEPPAEFAAPVVSGAPDVVGGGEKVLA